MKRFYARKFPDLHVWYYYTYTYVGQDHISNVETALLEVSERWKDIGQVLGLGDNLLSLDEMVIEWLNTSKASLLRLVGAIATENGGKNPSHAERVAKAFDKGKCRAGKCTCMMNVNSTSINFSLLVALMLITEGIGKESILPESFSSLSSML